MLYTGTFKVQLIFFIAFKDETGGKSLLLGFLSAGCGVFLSCVSMVKHHVWPIWIFLVS